MRVSRSRAACVGNSGARACISGIQTTTWWSWQLREPGPATSRIDKERGGEMITSRMARRGFLVVATAMLMLLGTARADLNPAALAYKLPNQIKWTEEANGAKQAVLRGDLAKPGPYIVLVKWEPHRMS